MQGATPDDAGVCTLRLTIKWAIRLCLLGLSFESIVRIVDYLGRWDWLEGAMVVHPIMASIVRGPTFPLLCLGVAILMVYGERYLKLPSVMARYTNSRINPNLATTPMQIVVDTETKKPGWDKQDIDWYWLIEVRLANESETPITVEDIEGKVRVGGNKWLRWLFPITRKYLPVKHVRDVTKFSTTPHEGHPGYEPLSGLLQNIKGVPLTKGIGHRGWLCFALRANQQEMHDKPSLDVWLIDALYGRHRLIYKKDDKAWDMSFDILRDV
jgi:hypothetical protein